MPDSHADGDDDGDDDTVWDDLTDATPPTPVPLHIVRGWDEEARASAWDEAQRASERDPDAAAYLMACLETDTNGDTPRARSKHDYRRLPSAKPFDPMRMIAHVVKFYGFADADVMRMPWKRLLAYAREADIMTEEENKHYKDTPRQAGVAGTSDWRASRDMTPNEVRSALHAPGR